MKKTKKLFYQPKLQVAKISKKNGKLLIEFPHKVAEYLGLEDRKTLYWAPINGSLQVCGDRPNMSIPLIKVSKKSFIQQ